MEGLTKINYVLGRVLDTVTYILGLPGYFTQKPALSRFNIRTSNDVHYSDMCASPFIVKLFQYPVCYDWIFA